MEKIIAKINDLSNAYDFLHHLWLQSYKSQETIKQQPNPSMS